MTEDENNRADLTVGVNDRSFRLEGWQAGLAVIIALFALMYGLPLLMLWASGLHVVVSR